MLFRSCKLAACFHEMPDVKCNYKIRSLIVLVPGYAYKGSVALHVHPWKRQKTVGYKMIGPAQFIYGIMHRMEKKIWVPSFLERPSVQKYIITEKKMTNTLDDRQAYITVTGRHWIIEMPINGTLTFTYLSHHHPQENRETK